MKFFDYARARYQIFLDRQQGKSWPWTTDPVLLQFRFCNIFREDDRTTIWFRKNIRDPLRNDPIKVATATVAFRWFNRIETGERIKHILLNDGWHAQGVKEAVIDLHPMVTGAHMTKTPAGMSKLAGICWAMERLTDVEKLRCGSLQYAHWMLMRSPYLGGFMAYETITDLRHTVVLEDADDIMTWANPGPGCRRGILRVLETDRVTKDEMQLIMQDLLAKSTRSEYWPSVWPSWELRDVEHTLCEFSKYMQGLEGKRLKRRYSP